MKHTHTYLGWLLLAAATLSWCGVVYFALGIRDARSALETQIQLDQQSFVERNSAVRTHAIVADTTEERDRLDAFVAPEVSTIAAALRAVGKTGGVTISLGSATPENVPGASDQSSIQAVGFSLQADGTFSALMRTIQLIESLPLASHIDRFDLQRGPDATSARWHMNVYIRILTAAAPS